MTNFKNYLVNKAWNAHNYDKRKSQYTKQLCQPNKILNVYNLNILNAATFLHKVK